MTNSFDSRLPSFSVVIPTYNRAHIIERAVTSVLKQTFSDFELIIVDDGSTDNTKTLIKQINDERIHYHYQANSGVSAARNAGAGYARGQFLTFLDSDDEALAHWLTAFANKLQTETVGVVCAGIKIVTTETNTVAVRIPQNLGPVYYNKAGLFRSGSFALRRELFVSIGGYTKGLAYSENTDLALRLTSACVDSWEFATIQEPLVIYHREPLRWSESPEKHRIRLESAKYMLCQHGERYRAYHSRGDANLCAVAGVNAARLNDLKTARTFFRAAIRSNPRNIRHIARYLATFAPLIGTRFWLRHSI